MNIRQIPLLQNLFLVGLGPSSKICPWCPPHFLQWYSVLGDPIKVSILVSNTLGSAWKNDGQPLPLSYFVFDSKTKYESGSGWPSFYESLPDVFETKTDHHIGYARTEYHCKKCGGHHGHIFEDGPEPTGKRFCNNGACLVFKPKE